MALYCFIRGVSVLVRVSDINNKDKTIASGSLPFFQNNFFHDLRFRVSATHVPLADFSHEPNDYKMKKLKLDELGRMSVDQFKDSEKLPVVIVLDNVRSLHNVGSAFRTADAFRIEKIILTGITGTPPHREIEKTALGATQSVAWSYEEATSTALQKLKSEDYLITLVEQTSESQALHRFEISEGKKYCLVFGNEVNGISEDCLPLADGSLEIPQFGTKHSLNVSVCLGIVAWEFFKKLMF
jgi:23S rRNA (guanosine2251-2'-O)-methyltransferase